MCDLHFKFEEDLTKTGVAIGYIESDRHSFGQTDTSSDFISVQCHELHWTDNNAASKKSKHEKQLQRNSRPHTV